jgi:hypothetical protein
MGKPVNRKKKMIKEQNRYLDVDDLNDFGFFSFSSEEEVISANPIYSNMGEEVTDLRMRLRAIQKIFLPLLENLNKDPDKAFIKWPQRKEVLDKQIIKLKNITNV